VILAVETSCDDTCAAVIDRAGEIHSNVISSQHAHDRFGGVVPEIASRHHLELIDVVISRALEDADITLEKVELIAATQGPGLIGALLVGLSHAKALAASAELPFAPIDHLQGHVAANFLSDPNTPESPPMQPPFLCLIASGGHTLLAHVREHCGMEVIGRTLDDAAGEAFDKGARMLGLGYPGGPALERLARDGDPRAFEFPAGGVSRRSGLGAGRVQFARSMDFSFAGLKTALLYRIRDLGEDTVRRRAADLAASYQAAIIDHLLARARQGLEATGLERLAVGGGVAANGELRRRLPELPAVTHIPAPVLCTDNAAMIASAARFQRPLPYPDYLALDAYATGERAA
jgi:N6-L-threonylcarbamoyladenine synthase